MAISTIDNNGANLGQLGNRNLIINGEFLISQRGDYTSATSLTNNTYYLDRFINRNGVAGTIQQTSNMPTGETGKSVKMLTTASGTAQFVLEQFIEPQTWMTSKTYTASCWIKSNSDKCSLTLINNGNFADRVSHTGGGDWEKITLTFNIGSTLSDFRLRIGLSQGGNTSISSGDYFEFTQLQLEVGDTATPFEHRSYGEELAKCKRYYANYKSTTAQSHMALPYSGFATSTTLCELWGSHPAEMRVPPTISVNSVTAFRVAQALSDQDTNNMYIDFIGTNSFRLRANVPSGLTAGQGVGLLNKANTLAIINFDAEL